MRLAHIFIVIMSVTLLVSCVTQQQEVKDGTPHLQQLDQPEGNHLSNKASDSVSPDSIDEAQNDSAIDVNEDFIGGLRMQHGNPPSGGPKALTTTQLQLVVDGVALNIEPRPFIEDHSTLLPLRALSTHFGAGVWWNAETKTVGITKGDTNVAFVIGSTTARVSGQQVNVPSSTIVNGTTFVPIRFISETFGYQVGWNGSTKTVRIDTTPNTYTVVAGDTLSSIAKQFGSTVSELSSLNNLSDDTIHVGQTLMIRSQPETQPDATSPEQEQAFTTYTVVSGDSLSQIANRFGTTVEAIRSANQLTSDAIYVNQRLRIPTGANASPGTDQGVTVTYKTHTVQSGDNAWNLSIKYGLPMLELLKENNLSINSNLSIGQKLRIPVYNVPVKPAVSGRHGELLDWWTEARYVFPIGKNATVTDFRTGRTFNIRHTMGGNHADSEPATSRDAQIIKEVWGGSYSWTPRAVIVTVDGRKLAAAMHSFPHGDQSVRDNNYTGHFCIHFRNSTRHRDGLVQDSMQQQIQVSAGVN